MDRDDLGTGDGRGCFRRLSRSTHAVCTSSQDVSIPVDVCTHRVRCVHERERACTHNTVAYRNAYTP